MSLKNIINDICEYSIKNELCNTAIGGLSLYDINFKENNLYDIIFVTPSQNHVVKNNLIEYNLRLYYLDRLLRDNSNNIDILTASVDTLQRLINIIKELNGVLKVNNDYQIVNFADTQRLSDNVAGSYVDITITALNTNGICDSDAILPEINVIKIKYQTKNINITENGDYNVTFDNGYNALKEVNVNVNIDTDSYYEDGYNTGKIEGYNEGYEQGEVNGREEQKSLIQPITITENGEYTNENGYSPINVNIDTDSYYNNGYNEGYVQGESEGYNDGFSKGFDEGVVNGKEEQKSLLENIKITENGVYDNENGYDVVEVEVDTQSYYDEGYRQAEEDVVKDAQVLNITENGTYKTKYSDINVDEKYITGYYDDGTPFYNYALLNDIVYDTQIKALPTTTLEIWFKSTEYNGMDNCVIGTQVYVNSIFKIVKETGVIKTEIAMSPIIINAVADKWYHIEMSYDNGLWVDGEKIGNYSKNVTPTYGNLFINSLRGGDENVKNNYIGMIKIDGQTIIPTIQGFYNVTTDSYLPILAPGEYIFTEATPPKLEGNLIKEVNVNVFPKVYVIDGLKFGYSKFNSIPDYYDFEGVTDFSYMFYGCNNLVDFSYLDTSNANNMSQMFASCSSLKTIPLIDTNKVINMSYMFYACGALTSIPQLDTSNVTNMYYMFRETPSLITIPQLDTSNVTNMQYMFYNYNGSNCKLQSLPPLECGKVTNMSNYFGHQSYSRTTLTDVGGWINLKQKWDDGYGLNTCPNLTYESCINILNGLYDFTGNGETPNSNQGKLKVSQSFMDLVGDEISIGTNKGWTITV